MHMFFTFGSDYLDKCYQSCFWTATMLTLSWLTFTVFFTKTVKDVTEFLIYFWTQIYMCTFLQLKFKTINSLVRDMKGYDYHCILYQF